MNIGVGEEFGGGEALGHGVAGVVGDLVEGFEGVFGVALGADLGLEIGEFFAEIQMVFGIPQSRGNH